MTDKEKVEQLEDLIQDRKSFLTGDKECDAIFLKDIETLKWAINELKYDGYDQEIHASPVQDFGESM